MTTAIASIALGLVAVLDLAATVFVVRSPLHTPVQKALQLVLTWAVPFVGSIIVVAVLKDTIAIPRARRGSGAGDVWLPGIGPESEGSGGHHGHYSGGSDAGHGGDGGGH